MTTGHQILKKNEADANGFLERVMLVLCVLSVIYWVLEELGVIPVPDPVGTVLFLGGAIVNLGAVMLSHRLNGKTEALKYAMVFLVLLNMSVFSTVSVSGTWIYMLLPVIVSVRYYDKNFTIMVGMATSALLALGMLVYARNPVLYYVRYQIAFIIIIVICASIAKNGRQTIEQQQRSADEILSMQKRMQKNKMQIMTSQVQPHFINNTLNTICYLIEENPKQAIKAATDFASYLQVNLNMLQENPDIDFEYELDHIMTYLNLEKLRFGDKLKTVFEINSTDFRIPSLTVQPIVENAVKHGVCSRMEGGTVKISTRELKDSYEIVVEDDGVGFDVEILDSQNTENMGINNIKTRLLRSCGGTLDVQSGPFSGTKVTFMIPKETE